MTFAPLRLRKQEERRLAAGHLWVYSNEVDIAATPLTAFEPGQPVLIEAANGKPLGTGYVNPHSLICARLVSRDPQYSLSQSLLVHRLNVALALRARRYEKPYYRLVHGEGDALPGLVIDRFNDVVVAQLTTAGMERVRSDVIGAIQKVLAPRAIILRNDSSVREMEGLARTIETACGEAPSELVIEENGARFTVPALSGQKTGWFFDHRENRARLCAWVAGKRVLDVFSYAGAWGIPAAMAGASEVLCVDSSAPALDALRANAQRNDVAALVRTEQEDAFEALKKLRAERQRFDIVVIDPPALIKRRKDLREGTTAYRRLNQMAMQVLERDGLLVSASCSFHLERDSLLEVVQAGARHLDRFAQLVEEGHQAPDHPSHPAIPETNYLKCLTLRVLPS
jgi:23S rRNA (cytosine1962-C5)-methyltransferase